jgi:hypothetical protein
MTKLTTGVALATFIASPVFETPADAVMIGLLAAIAAMGITTIASFAVSLSRSRQQRSPPQPADLPAAAARRSRMRRSLRSALRWVRPGASGRFSRRVA